MSLTRQLAQVVPTVLGALILVFFMLRVLPGDPATAMRISLYLGDEPGHGPGKIYWPLDGALFLAPRGTGK